MKTIEIHIETIQLDQALKKEGIISTGGEIAPFLEKHCVTMNGEKIYEKRKKLREGDVLRLDTESYMIVREP